MPKRPLSLTTCAVLSVLVFILLILSRCQGNAQPTEIGTGSAAPAFEAAFFFSE